MTPSESAPESSQATPEQIFDAALERYKAGAAPADLIPTFQQLCDRDASNSAAWTCLSWLHLLEQKPELAHKEATRALKLNRAALQSRVNLVLAMLATSRKGVREQVDLIKQALRMSPELAEEIVENLEDGLQRRPDWAEATRLKSWLFGKES